MPDLIKIKGGNNSVPKLQDRELGYSKNEKALYIGTDNGNVKLCCADDIQAIVKLDERIRNLEARVEEGEADG